MAIAGDLYEFSKENVAKAPDVHGVYALYDGDELVYYGRAIGTGVTIRSRLLDHVSGREGATKNATGYKREPNANAAARERQLLLEYQLAYNRLPRYNEVMP